MFLKKISFILAILLIYQSPLYSKSTSFNNFNSKNLSNYFSGIVAFENKENSLALDFFNSSKNLLNQHDPYLKKYIHSLVLDNKINQAINIIKTYEKKNNSNFFDAKLLLIIDSLKKKDLNKANIYLQQTTTLAQKDRFNFAILEILSQYLFVFKENEIPKNKKILENYQLFLKHFKDVF